MEQEQLADVVRKHGGQVQTDARFRLPAQTAVSDKSILLPERSEIRHGVWKRIRFAGNASASMSLVGASLEDIHVEGPLDLLSIATSNISRLHVGKVNHLRIQQCQNVHQIEFSGFIRDLTIENCAIDGTCFDLTTSDLRIAHTVFRGGSWSPTIEHEAIIESTSFIDTRVNLRNLVASCFDRGTIDMSRAKVEDDWSELRDDYSGPRLFIVLVLTAAFILPYLARIGYFFVLSRLAEPAQLVLLNRYLVEALIYGAEENLLLKIAAVAMFCLLAYYSAARLVLTFRVSKLREREEHMQSYGFRRFVVSDSSISRHMKFHKAQKLIFWFASFYSLWRVAQALALPVPVGFLH